ncbi:outer membrane lipoprotein carrier protein LolA [Alienimonas sp. DA493]|uniref:LolA family protein n=1 Tax=Alienimonas sp. DA493 TaxID=3373605 RepID=UPI0037546F4A
MIPRLLAASLLLFYAPLVGTAQNAAGAKDSPPNPAGAPTGPAGDETPVAAPRPDTRRTAGRILDEARARVNAVPSLSANLRQTAVVGGHRFDSEGRLLLADGGRVRFELNPAPEQQELGPSLLQICDGAVMHTQYGLDERVAVTRRNVRTVRAEAAARASGASLAGDLACGGLAGVLASLRTSMRWEEPRIETIADRPYLVLTGRWTESVRAVFAERAKERKLLPDPPPPTGVTVYLDEETLFPHRIRYWSQTENGPRIPMLTLDLSAIRVNVALPDDAFTFTLPDDVEVDDLTEPAVVRARTAGLPNPAGAAEDENADGTNSE